MSSNANIKDCIPILHWERIEELLEGWGYEIHEADDGSTAVEKVNSQAFDLILMDIRMVKMSGLEALNEIKIINPAIPIIIMTAYSSVETAVEALKNGAYDYLTKPLDFDDLRLTMSRAMEHVHLRKENLLLRESLGTQFDLQNIIGRSRVMSNLLETVAQVAPSEATVLLTGDSGTGKEMIAGAIHFNSPRKDAPFIKINCAAITESLLESELFGHERGAFTGATVQKKGLLELAEGGTILLNEIGELVPFLQSKLLAFLDTNSFMRVGGQKSIRVDARLIAATHRDLGKEVSEKRFLEPLFYRLSVFPIDVPSLGNRLADIPILVEEILSNLAREMQIRTLPIIDEEQMRLLKQYHWPGNVPEHQ